MLPLTQFADVMGVEEAKGELMEVSASPSLVMSCHVAFLLAGISDSSSPPPVPPDTFCRWLSI